MTAMEIWLLERAEPLYKIYPWKALLRAGSRGCAETDYGQNLMQKMMMSYDSEPDVYKRQVLYEEDLLITMTQQEGYMTEGDNEVTVVLDTNLTPELLEEGMVRELISKIQTMRKEAGFEVMDKITVSYKADQKVKDIFAKYGEEIAKEVLAESVVADTVSGYQKEWNINGETVVLGVEKK